MYSKARVLYGCALLLALLVVLASFAPSTFTKHVKAQPSTRSLVYLEATDSPSAKELWVANADGSDKLRLVEKTEGMANPQWSPDGTQIAFSTEKGVSIINADGTGLRQVTDFDSGKASIAWSPDGKQLVFSGIAMDRRHFGIKWINVDGSGLRLYDQIAGRFVWSADPDILYVVSVVDEQKFDFGLFEFNLKTLQKHALTSLVLDEFNPYLSPDGTQMLLVAKGRQMYTVDVYVTDLKFNNPRLIIGGSDSSLFLWSQDGKGIISYANGEVLNTDIVSKKTAPIPSLSGTLHQWLQTPTATVMAENTDAAPTATPQAELAPTGIAVQPSAEKVTPLIAYVRSDANSATPDALYISNPDGTAERILIDTSANLTIDYLAWSPDGKQLTYSASPFGSGFGAEINRKFNVYTINVEDKTIQQLTDCPTGCLDAAWSPDGKELAFTLQKIGQMGWQADVMVRDLATGEDRLIRNGLNEAAFYTERCYSSAWSPDGQEIAYLCYSGSQGDVFISNPTGTTQRQVTHNRPLASIDDLAWSPDGRQLLFSLSGTNAYELDNGVYVVNRDGSGFKEIEGFRCGRGGVTWSADGSEIFIVARRKDSQGVTIVPNMFDLIAVNPRTMAYRTVKLDIGFWVAPIPRPTNVCTVTATRTVNIREGAGTDTKVVAKMEQGDAKEVVARTKGSDGRFWWQLAQGGFVREDLVNASATCSLLN